MIQSITRMTKILDIISDKNEEGITLTEIAAAVNLGIPTTYNILRTLSEHNYIEQNKKGRKYHLGARNYILGSKYRSSNALLEIGEPILFELNAKFNEHAVIAIWENYNVILLKDLPSTRNIVSNPRYMPDIVHCTGCGKIFLAHLSKQELDFYIKNYGLKRFTAKTIVTKSALYEEVKKIREQGYSLVEEELDEGSSSIGVPVYDINNKVKASVAMSLPSMRFKGSIKEEIIKTLREAGEKISRELKKYNGDKSND